MGSCCIETATLIGIEAVPVHAEVEVAQGLPGIEIVGLPDAAVQEARQRVRCAIRASGLKVPQGRVVVNLAPGPLRKTGSGFDLPIALGMLCASGQVDPRVARGRLAVGELSLTGEVRPVRGMVAYAACALRLGKSLLAPGFECGGIPLGDLAHARVRTLGELAHGHVEEGPASRVRKVPEACACPDFADIAGHEYAKRALEIAAAGGHGLLMVGPPGSGKTMLAQRLPSILPPLTSEETLQTALVHSVAGLPIDPVASGTRPFVAPHHSSTIAGLLGGGTPVRPGAVTLAHNGVLFLDEMPEFSPHALQALRQPMESGIVALVRAEGTVVFPARFMLVGASNPCPCGHYGDPQEPCTCSEAAIRRYQGRIGGPIMDRLDMRIDVPRLDPELVLKTGTGTPSSEMRERVAMARAFAAERHPRTQDAEVARGKELVEACHLAPKAEASLERIGRSCHLSGRGVMGALAIARTIADLEQSDRVDESHILEAMGYRMGGEYA